MSGLSAETLSPSKGVFIIVDSYFSSPQNQHSRFNKLSFRQLSQPVLSLIILCYSFFRPDCGGDTVVLGLARWTVDMMLLIHSWIFNSFRATFKFVVILHWVTICLNLLSVHLGLLRRCDVHWLRNMWLQTCSGFGIFVPSILTIFFLLRLGLIGFERVFTQCVSEFTSQISRFESVGFLNQRRE